SNGEALECTYYHKFYVQKNYKGTVEIVEAKDLKQGDKLIKYQLPLIQSENDLDFPYAYTAGFFSGDGSYGNNGMPEVDLYGVKKELLPLLAIRNKYRGNGSIEKGTFWRKETDTLGVYHDSKQDRIVCKLPLDIPSKFTVPLNGYTIKS
ncbi:MAG: ribonucleoside-diphosphate reductase, partial [Microcystis sp.]